MMSFDGSFLYRFHLDRTFLKWWLANSDNIPHDSILSFFKCIAQNKFLTEMRVPPKFIACICKKNPTYFPWLPLPILSFSIFSEIILISNMLFIIGLSIASSGLQLLYFFPLEFVTEVHRDFALEAKVATVFLQNHDSHECCSPGIPRLHSVWHQLSSHSSKAGDSSTPVARLILNLVLGRVFSVQAELKKRSLFAAVIMTVFIHHSRPGGQAR